MKKFKYYITFTIITLLPILHTGLRANTITDWIPSTSAFVLYTKDIKDLSKKLQSHPISSSIELSQVGKAEWERVTGQEGMDAFAKLLEHFKGECTLFFDMDTLSMGMITEFDGNIDKLLNQLDEIEKATGGSNSINALDQLNEDEFLGTRLFNPIDDNPDDENPLDDMTFTVHQGYFIFSDSPDMTKNIIQSMQDGLEQNISNLENWVDMQEELKSNKSDLLMFVNIKGAIESGFDLLNEKGLKIPANDFMVSNESIRQALALDELHAIGGTINFDGEEIYINSGFSYGEEKGLIKLLAYRDEKVESPIFIPDDVFSASIMNFSVPEFWQAFEEIIQTVSPQLFATYQMMLPMYEAQFQISLKNDIVANLGDKIGFFSYFQETSNDLVPFQTEQLFAVSLVDQQQVALVINKLLMLVGGPNGGLISQEEYQGSTIYSVNQATSEGDMSFALSNNMLYINQGNVDNLRRILSQSPKSTNSIWENQQVKSVCEDLFDTPVSLNYSDYSGLVQMMQGPIMDNFISGFIAGQATNPKNSANIDIKKILEGITFKLPYIAIGGMEKKEHFFLSKGVMTPKK